MPFQEILPTTEVYVLMKSPHFLFAVFSHQLRYMRKSWYLPKRSCRLFLRLTQIFWQRKLSQLHQILFFLNTYTWTPNSELNPTDEAELIEHFVKSWLGQTDGWVIVTALSQSSCNSLGRKTSEKLAFSRGIFPIQGVLPDVRIPEREERRLPKTVQLAKKGKFIKDSNQGSCRASNTVVRGQRALSRGGYPNL